MLQQEKVLVKANALKQKKIAKQKGASMIEYALVVAAVVAIGAVVFGGNAGSLDKAVKDKVSTVAGQINPS